MFSANGRPDSRRSCIQYKIAFCIQYSFIHGNILCQNRIDIRLPIVDRLCKAEKLLLRGNETHTASGTSSILVNPMLLFGCIPGVVVGNTALSSIYRIIRSMGYGMRIRLTPGQSLSPQRIARTCRAIQEPGYLAACKLGGCFAINIHNLTIIIIDSFEFRSKGIIIITVFDGSEILSAHAAETGTRTIDISHEIALFNGSVILSAHTADIKMTIEIGIENTDIAYTAAFSHTAKQADIVRTLIIEIETTYGMSVAVKGTAIYGFAANGRPDSRRSIIQYKLTVFIQNIAIYDNIICQDCICIRIFRVNIICKPIKV